MSSYQLYVGTYRLNQLKGEGHLSQARPKLGLHRTWQAGLLYIDVVDDTMMATVK